MTFCFPCFVDRKVVFVFSCTVNACISQFQVRPEPPPPLPPPRALPFFGLGWKIPGVGTLELSNPPGWGPKKRANALSSVNTATFFIDCTVE